MILQPKLARWAVPLLKPRRYKGVKGGRSGGKSHQLMEITVADMAARDNFKVACIREIQKSIRFSVKSLMEQKIYEQGAAYLFDIQDAVIKRIGGDGIAIFEGMQDHTADSVKGLESFNRALVDEANALSERSLRLLRPTIRAQGSELHFAWNPEFETDPVDVMFRENDGDPDFICLHANITDNPFVSDTAWDEYKREKALAEKKAATDPNAWPKFLHTWHGAYNTRSDKIIFHNWRVAELTPPERVIWYGGVDFGFAADPLFGLRCCLIDDRILYIDNEFCEVGVANEAVPVELAKAIPDLKRTQSIADSARPELIDYCRRHGLPKMRGARKGPGSVEDGIGFLQSFDIVLHPRCANLKREFERYSYLIDKRTEAILPEPEDANNHGIDALRYATERLHRKGKLIPIAEREKDDRLETLPDYRGKSYRSDVDEWKVA